MNKKEKKNKFLLNWKELSTQLFSCKNISQIDGKTLLECVFSLII